MHNGFIVIDKNAGATSAHVVGCVKHVLYLLGEKKTKLGHFGTLDPEGEGVLPIAIGRATKLFAYQEGKVKVYRTEFKFGVSTDTLDTTGNVLKISGRLPTLAEVKRAADRMTGKYMQIPPLYSAKSVNGKRAYALARKGIAVDLPPNEVEIFGISKIEQRAPDVFLMEISVSAGTYIRSVARDMGEILQTYGVMQYIKRLQSGVFTLNEAVKIGNLNFENFAEHLLPIQFFLQGFPCVDVPEALSKILLTGSELYGLTLPDGDFCVRLTGELIGIGAKTAEGNLKVKTWLRE